jgi:integrase/recombinase XerD
MRLGDALRTYISAKQSRGIAFESTGRVLRSFARVAGLTVAVSKIRTETVAAFLNSHGTCARTWNHKYHALHGFWSFAIERGYTDWSPLPPRPLREPATFVPRIYTHEELKRLIDGTNTYQRRRCQVEIASFRAILLLLYGAGLRIGEAVRLTCGDVNLEDATLTIRCTKFGKTRCVAVNPQLCNILREYDLNRRDRGYRREERSPFFTFRNGQAITRDALEDNFRTLRQHVGVGVGPFEARLHDLRHTFAVHRLIAWYKQGSDVQKLLPALAIHLGHTDLISTQAYLTMTPELLVQASLRFEGYAQGGPQ